MAKFPHTWTGQAFAAPRTELKDLLARPELDSPGIYVLHGETALNDPVAYIGVGKSVRNRLKNRKEEFWNHAIVFVGTGGNLHEGNVKHLEGKLIDEAKAIGRFKIENEQPSGSPLPEHEEAAMDVFLSKMRILLPVLGCNLLVPKTHLAKGKPLVCRIKGLIAYGNRTAEGFVVFKGSEAVLQARTYATQTKNWTYLLRQKLLSSGLLIKQADRLKFTQDCEFKSPSAAAAIVRGGNASGPREWRTEDGTTLGDLEAI